MEWSLKYFAIPNFTKMRNRLLLLVISSLFFMRPAFAQCVVPGITAGASFNNTDLDLSPELSTDLDKVNGVEAGLYLSFSTGAFYIKPTAVASFLKGTVTTRPTDGAKPVESDFQLSTLETPVIIGLKILPVLSVEAGPSWNYLISYTDKIEGVSIDLDRHSFGYRAGLRANFSRFGIFGHYGGIIDSNDDTDFHLNRPSRIVVGLTFDLVSSK